MQLDFIRFSGGWGAAAREPDGSRQRLPSLSTAPGGCWARPCMAARTTSRAARGRAGARPNGSLRGTHSGIDLSDLPPGCFHTASRPASMMTRGRAGEIHVKFPHGGCRPQAGARRWPLSV